MDRKKASDYPQELLNLFDRYVHGDLDRRGFLDGAKINHVNYAGYVYEGAQHGFHNDTTPRYDEAAAKLAWKRTLETFNRYLRS